MSMPSRAPVRAATALAFLLMCQPASGAGLPAEVMQEITIAAGRGEPLHVRDLIASRTQGDTSLVAAAYAAAIAASERIAAKKPRAAGQISEHAIAAAVDMAAEAPDQAHALALTALRTAHAWAAEVPATALMVATGGSKVAAAIVKAKPSAAVELALAAIQVGGPAAGGASKNGAALSRNAHAVGEALKLTNPQVAMQINTQLRKHKLL